MISSNGCFDSDDMRMLLSGRLTDREADPLEQHLLYCEACLQAARRLPADTLSDVAIDPEPDPGPAWRGAADALIHRFGNLKLAADGLDSGTADSPTPGGVETDELPAAEKYPFLAPATAPGDLGCLGRYRMVRVLGEGGMGLVFQARDVKLARDVAVKVMRPNVSYDARTRERFLREARAMAAVEHDHIVAVHEANEENGVPFFTMPLLRGESLEQRLKRPPRLPIREAIRIARESAEGLTAAHARGLIHRDVKPGNIWLEDPDGRVKILDFGLVYASGADDARLTRYGIVLGSPGYLAPEQLEGADAKPASDLFSLGCVLYRMVTGEPPFQGKDWRALLGASVSIQPPAPSTLDGTIPVELSDLTMRLLAKDPERRPASAADVVVTLTAIEHGLTATPTVPSLTAGTRPAAKSRKWSRRMVGIAAAACLFAAVGFFGTNFNKKIVPIALRLQRDQILPEELAAAGGGNPSKAPVGLIGVLGDSRRKGWDGCNGVACSPDGKLIAGTGRDGRVELWDAGSGKLIRVLVPTRAQGTGAAVAFSPDGKCLAAAIGANLWVWAVSDGWLVFDPSSDAAIRCLAFNPDGIRVATGHDDGRVYVWGLTENKADLERKRYLTKTPLPVAGLAFSPDGTHLAIGTSTARSVENPGEPGQVQLLNVATAKAEVSLEQSDKAGISVAYSPDGKQLVGGGGTAGTIAVWDAASGQLIRLITAHDRLVKSLAFSPDGARLASASYDRTARVWDAKTLEPVLTYTGQRDQVAGIAFSPDGKSVASCGGEGGGVHVWDAATGKDFQPIAEPAGAAYALAQSPDGHTVAVASEVIQLYDVSGVAPVKSPTLDGHKGWIYGLAFNNDGKFLASASDDGTFIVWDVVKGAPAFPPVAARNGALRCVAFSPDGRLLATGHVKNGPIMLWDSRTGERVDMLRGHDDTVRAVAFSRDGRLLASASDDRTVRLWDPAGGNEIRSLKGHTDAVYSLAFTPDSSLLVSGGEDKKVKVWRTADGTPVAFRGDSEGPVTAVAVNSDGRLLSWAGSDGVVRLRELSGTHAGVIRLNPYGAGYSPVFQLCFSADGRHLITANGNSTAYILLRPDAAEKAVAGE
jgi:WD40 repeat protein